MNRKVIGRQCSVFCRMPLRRDIRAVLGKGAVLFHERPAQGGGLSRYGIAGAAAAVETVFYFRIPDPAAFMAFPPDEYMASPCECGGGGSRIQRLTPILYQYDIVDPISMFHCFSPSLWDHLSGNHYNVK